VPWYLDYDPQVDRICRDRFGVLLKQRESRPEYFVVNPEWPLEKKTNEWPMVAREDRATLTGNERRKEFIRDHCTFMAAFGKDHQWAIYRVNPLPARTEESAESELTKASTNGG
jgi:hypothetical protein